MKVLCLTRARLFRSVVIKVQVRGNAEFRCRQVESSLAPIGENFTKILSDEVACVIA